MDFAPGPEWNPFVDPKTCTVGQLCFLVVVYGYALFQASNLISDGSELLVLVPAWAEVVGSIVLPVLGAVPDGMMVLVSGLGSNAQEQVAVGVGALAGSTVMLLTLPWFLSMLAGRVSVSPEGVMRYKRPKNADDDWDKLETPGSLSLTRTGVGFMPELKDNNRLMLFTLLGYVIIQLPAFNFDGQLLREPGVSAEAKQKAQGTEARNENQWAFVGLVFCFLSFGYYLWKMWADSQSNTGLIDDMITAANVDALRDGKLTLRGALSKFRESSWCNLKENKELQEALVNKDALDEVRRMCKVLAPFFGHYDLNGDNQIDFEEFRMIFRDVRENLPKDMQKEMFDSADTDNSGFITFEEFVACMMTFALDPSTNLQEPRQRFRKDPANYLTAEMAGDEDAGKDDDDEDGEEEEDMPEDLADLEPEEQQRRIKLRAFYNMALGSFIVLVISDPTVDVMSEIGRRIDVNPFYVSFVLAPLASNATELVAAYNLAGKRTIKSMTTSLSSLLGAGVMNNTFCLGIFLGLIYFKHLAWEFTAETASIVLVEVIVGAIVHFRKNLLMLHGVIILMLYPLSLFFVWFLENKLNID